MNVLIVGTNTRMAKVFKNFANASILTDKEFRYYDEILEFKVLESEINSLKFTSLISRFIELRKIIKSDNIDIIFTNEKVSMIAAYFAVFFSRKKIVLLSTSHNSYAWLNKTKVGIFAKIIKVCTHGYISLSSHVSDLLIRNGVDNNRILTTVNPIEKNVFKVKTNYSIIENICIVYVGVIYKGKGQDILLEAVKKLKNEGVNVVVNFYGDIIEKAFYKTLLEFIKSNHLEQFVKFHGRIENFELRSILCEYDIYICPSEMEMSPYNLIEAKASGLPVIASRVGGIPDIISNNVDGILVEPSSSEQLSQAIRVLVKDEKMRETMGVNAFNSSKIKHSPKVISKKLQLFISSL